MPAPTFISDQEVKELLDPQTLLVSLEDAMGEFSKGEAGSVVQPVRTVIPVKENLLFAKPAYNKKDDALATKMITLCPKNPEKGLPMIQAYIFAFDATNGRMTAVMDGDYITGLRTGVASAVATKYLAPENSKILAIIGSGIQARSHYTAMNLLQKYDEIKVYSKTKKNAEAFVKEMNDSKIKLCDSAQEACKDADIICVCVFSATPVIQKSWVKEGAHVNSVGANKSDMQEVDPDLMESAVVYADTKEGCEKETGDLVLTKAKVFGEIGEVINGTKKGFRNKTTIFKSSGMAIEDVVSAKLVVDAYEARK